MGLVVTKIIIKKFSEMENGVGHIGRWGKLTKPLINN